MLYVVMELEQKNWWAEYGCRYALALLEAGVPLRLMPYGRAIVERTAVPEEFHPLLDTMLGVVEPCTCMLYIGDPAGAVELVSRGPGEVPEEKYALTTWPTDSLPSGFVAGLGIYDRVLVPSEACARSLRASGLRNVAVVSPPDPPGAETAPFVAPHPTIVAVGAWEGYGNAKGVLQAYMEQFSRHDDVLLHLVCPDAPFDDARGLEWQCANKEAGDMPRVSLATSLGGAVERAELFRACKVYVSAARRLDLDPFALEALRHGCNVVSPCAGDKRFDSDGVTDHVWHVPFLPCGAEECDIRGVDFSQMWGDSELGLLSEYMREAVEGRAPEAVPPRSLAVTGAEMAKAMVRGADLQLTPGEIAIRVVVPHKNRGTTFVSPCLHAIVPQLREKDSIVLVDQESEASITSEVMPVCFNLGVAVAPSEPGPGGAWSLASARNAGARFDAGKPFTHLFFLDCDCVVPEGFVEALRTRIRDSAGSIVIPVVVDSKVPERRPATGLAAMSAQAFTALGGYDEGYYGWGSEDVDFLWRARKRLGIEGSIMASPEITHIHHEPCSGRDEHGARNTQRFNAMAGEGGA